MKWLVAVAAASVCPLNPLVSIDDRERGAGMSARHNFKYGLPGRERLARQSTHSTSPYKTRVTRADEERIWVIGCRLMINYTDTIETADKMQRDLDDALNAEPCRRAAAEISLADRLRLIRDRIKELRDEEDEG